MIVPVFLATWFVIANVLLGVCNQSQQPTIQILFHFTGIEMSFFSVLLYWSNDQRLLRLFNHLKYSQILKGSLKDLNCTLSQQNHKACTAVINLTQINMYCIVYPPVASTPGTILLLCKKPTKQDLSCKRQIYHTSGRYMLPTWLDQDRSYKDIKLHSRPCPLLPLNNEQPDTAPVSNCPPLWPGLAQSGAQQALKDTQVLHLI